MDDPEGSKKRRSSKKKKKSKKRRKKEEDPDTVPTDPTTIPSDLETTEETAIAKWKGSEHMVTFDYNVKDAQKLAKLIEVIIGQNSEELNRIRCVKLSESKANPNTALMSRHIINLLRRSLVYEKESTSNKMLELLATEFNHRDHVLYKAAFHFLDNQTHVDDESLSIFIRSVMSFLKLNKREIVLDLINYKFRKQNFQKPQPFLELLLQLQSKLRKNATIDTLLKAYVSLYDYLEWKGLQNVGEDAPKEAQIGAKDKFTVALKPVLSVQGIWDIFVLKLQEVHEHYSEIDECHSALQMYYKKNMGHLHAKIYFYDFLKKHDRKPDKQLKLLREIAKMAPMDAHVIILARNLNSRITFSTALSLMYTFLDYPMNKHNHEAWSILGERAIAVFNRPKETSLKVLQESWKFRISYWPSYHFDASRIDLETESDALMCSSKCTFLMCVSVHETDMENAKVLPYLKAGTKALRKSKWPKAMKSVIKAMSILEEYKRKYI